ncbi:MAG: hypothetical protein LCH95_24710 [Proteobacteria bacterium]|nr:hypothetical protein [Pseudomonadota bacterium]
MIASSVFAALLTVAHPGTPVAPADRPACADVPIQAPIQAQYKPRLPPMPRLPKIPKPVIPGYP